MGFNDETVEFKDVKVERVHDAAVLCIIEGEKHWMPFSQIDDESEITKYSSKGDEGTLVVTEWVATEKNLI